MMDAVAETAAAGTEAWGWGIMRHNERLFGAADIPAILEGFAPDCVVRFADQPEIRGRAALEAFLRARFARQGGYSLEKTLRAVAGPVVVGTWVGRWTDTKTGARMSGRGTEILTMSGGLCTEWDATFNVWEADKGPSLSIT